jgi:hypothetical protein
MDDYKMDAFKSITIVILSDDNHPSMTTGFFRNVD